MVKPFQRMSGSTHGDDLDDFDLAEAAYDMPEAWPEDVAPLPADDGDLPPLREYLMSLLAAKSQKPRQVVNSVDWLKDVLSSAQGGTCAYCGFKVVRAKAGTADARRAAQDLLIPLESGGTFAQANRVVACEVCVKRKRTQDWLSFRLAVNRSSLIAARREALLTCGNHVLPLSVKGEAAGKATLAQRWRYPRFPVMAQVFDTAGYLGWDTRDLASERGGEVRARLRFEFQGRDLSRGRFALFEIPRDRWHEAAWALIEENALLLRPDMSERAQVVHPPFTPEPMTNEHLERWWVVLTGERWLQESIRVARWSAQAKPGQKVFAAQRREALRMKPYEDARERVARLHESVRNGTLPPVELRPSSVAPVLPSSDTARPLSPAMRTMLEQAAERQKAFLAAVREGRPLPRPIDPLRVAVAPEPMPERKALPSALQASLDTAKAKPACKPSSTQA